MADSPTQKTDGRPPGPAELRAQVHAEVARSGDLAFRSPPRGDRRPPRVVTEAERHGVPPTDHDARSPLGVGTSTSARAEKIAQREMETGRKKSGVEGPSRRPYGVSTPEHGTAAGGPIDEESPYLPPGDQAG